MNYRAYSSKSGGRQQRKRDRKDTYIYNRALKKPKPVKVQTEE